MTTSPEPTEHEYAKEPTSAFAKGRLMAVDWANGTARLDTPAGDSVLLRFDAGNIDMENRLRKLATCHVDVQGCLINNGSQQVVTSWKLNTLFWSLRLRRNLTTARLPTRIGTIGC